MADQALPDQKGWTDDHEVIIVTNQSTRALMLTELRLDSYFNMSRRPQLSRRDRSGELGSRCNSDLIQSLLTTYRLYGILALFRAISHLG